jgi:hypothetical protein
MNTRRKLHLTPQVAVWLLLDVCGMLLFAAGAMFMANAQALFVRWPGSMFEAGLMLVAGGVLMLVAAARLLRATLQQTADTPRKAASAD